MIKEEETRKKRKEESKGRQEKKKDFVSKFFPSFENSLGGRPFLRGVRNMNSSTLGAVGKSSDMRAVVSNLPTLNIFENCETTQTKVKTSTLDCQDKGKSIKHFVNPKMTPAADMRKVGTDGDGAHLDQMN